MENSKPFDPSQYLTKVGNADYLEVRWRLVWLRENHPDAIIETELLSHTDQTAAFKATISLRDGGSATGHGNESLNDFREFFEKAETKAIGRALAALGFGTQFCNDFDFGQGGGKVVDSPVAAQNGQRTTFRTQSNPNTVTGTHPTPMNGNLITEKQITYALKLGDDQGIDEQQVDDWANQRYGVPLNQLDKRQASEFIDQLKAQVRMNK